MRSDQMGQHFRVGGGSKGVAGLDQLLFEPVAILDDAVVDNGDFAGLIQMRMGVFVRGRAMSGPAGMADAKESGGRHVPQQGGQALVELALSLSNLQRAVVEHGHAGAVIAAVLQPAQSLEQDRRRLFLA